MLLRNILDLLVFIVKPAPAANTASRRVHRTKPLRMQTVYKGYSYNSANVIVVPNEHHQPLLEHFSLQKTRPTSRYFAKDTTFIGFNVITEGGVLVFPQEAQSRPKVWKQLVAYAKQHKIGIGTLHLTQNTHCRQISKGSVSVFLIGSHVLKGGRLLYK